MFFFKKCFYWTKHCDNAPQYKVFFIGVIATSQPLHPELCQWIDTIAMRFPILSKPQDLGLTLWGFVTILARSSSLTAVAEPFRLFPHYA